MKDEIQKQLEKLAYEHSTPFCYQDYIECPTGRCPKCGSDDLMRSVSGVGCEYGFDWIIKHILETELTPVNTEESFEQQLNEIYPETTKIAWAEFDTVQLLKEMDPVSWRCALAEYESFEESEGNIISFDSGSTYYLPDEVKSLT